MSGVHAENDGALTVVTHRIVVEMGLDADAKRSIRYEFRSLDSGSDAEIIPYFDGKLMLAVASDGFLINHGMIGTGEDD